MTVQEAKETVVLAGKRLVESGLIARTWGNVSCRISDTQFVITPSGRDYHSLTPEEIVEVQISDLSYHGDIKPSSEKGAHAEVYKQFPEVNFVIHTHQEYASALSVLENKSVPVSTDYKTLAGEVICADYGLPGTKKLREGIHRALTLSKGRAIIMKHHGALCFHTDYESTFLVATELEQACAQYLKETYLKSSGESDFNQFAMERYTLSKLTAHPLLTEEIRSQLSPCESQRSEKGLRLVYQDEVYHIAFDDLASLDHLALVSVEIKLHAAIYQSCKNIHAILHTYADPIYSVSCSGLTQYPLLDDFAQIAGTKIMNLPMLPKQIAKALRKNSVVFLQKNGALCCGASISDTTASFLVTKKNCRAFLSAALHGKVHYINPLESKLMRFVYLKKYSKQVTK